MKVKGGHLGVLLVLAGTCLEKTKSKVIEIHYFPKTLTWIVKVHLIEILDTNCAIIGIDLTVF